MCNDHRIDSFHYHVLDEYYILDERRIREVLLQPTPAPDTSRVLPDVLDRLRHPFSLVPTKD